MSVDSLAYAQEEYVQFFIATILELKQLLKPDKYKQIILDSLQILVSLRNPPPIAVVVYSGLCRMITFEQEQI